MVVVEESWGDVEGWGGGLRSWDLLEETSLVIICPVTRPTRWSGGVSGRCLGFWLERNADSGL
jgi:hypothetical protein